jgi:adenosylhomocysteine nucleosidase
MFPLGIVTGLIAEARLARVLGDTEAGGGLPEGAEAAAERLVARGARALLSFGLAGGLDPSLAAGAVLLPARVLESGFFHHTDPSLVARWGVPAGTLLSEHAVIADAAAKAALFAATGALAVDLESGAVARVAARHGLPFAVLRAVCDPADRSLPPAALAALGSDGAVGVLRVLRALGARPGQLPALMALARDAATARRALVAAVGPTRNSI